MCATPATSRIQPAQRADGDREAAMDIAVRCDLLTLAGGEGEERDQRGLVDLLGEALPLGALAGGQDLDGHQKSISKSPNGREAAHRTPGCRQNRPGSVAGERTDRRDARLRPAGHGGEAQQPAAGVRVLARRGDNQPAALQ